MAPPPLLGRMVSCEHASCAVPVPLQRLFDRHRRLLGSHHGWDIGAAEVAQAIARAWGLSPLLGAASRLVVDLNRSLHHRGLFGAPMWALTPAQRRQWAAALWAPYRLAAVHKVSTALKQHRRMWHLSAHTFTPIWRGRRRRTDVGLLYDPRRRGERAWAVAMRRRLGVHFPQLRVHLNRPYKGTSDGLCSALRQLFGHAYCGVEVELSQSFWALRQRPSAPLQAVVALLAAPVDDAP